MPRSPLRVAPAALALAGCFHDPLPQLTGGSTPLDPSTGAATTGETDAATSASQSAGSTSQATTDAASSTGTCPMGQPPQAWYLDGDGDGHGAGDPLTVACDPPPGAVDNADDCDDALADVHPGADEQCNALRDDDCDGLRDEYSPQNLECGGCGLAEFDGATWWACAAPTTFLAAEAVCQSFGAPVHLAHITDADQLAFARDLVLARFAAPPNLLTYWIGLHRAEAIWGDCGVHPELAAWVALDGAPVTFLAWGSGEPNNYGCDPQCTPSALDDPTCPREQCAELFNVQTGAYNDRRCTQTSLGHLCKAPLP